MRDRGRWPAGYLPAARDRPSRRQALHRSHFKTEARPRAEEIRQGSQARDDGLRPGRLKLRAEIRRPADDPGLPTIKESGMRIVFMGTPDFAVPTLSEIVGHGHDVVAVYSRAP